MEPTTVCQHLESFRESAPFSGSETVHQCDLLARRPASGASLNALMAHDPAFDLTHGYTSRECPYACRGRALTKCLYFWAATEAP